MIFAAPQWLFVRFEQGRGQTGIPKAHVPFWGPRDGKDTSVDTMVRVAVAAMRAMCCDQAQGHGQDLMPGDDWSEYQFHELDGGRITKLSDFKFQDHPTQAGTKVAEVVLTWGNPADLLARERNAR